MKKFKKTFVNVVVVHIPRKTKVLRGNHKPHVDKNFSEAIVKHSKLKNKANITKFQDNIIKYKKQRNLIVKLRGTLQGLRQFLITESPVKMMKNDFYFTFKALFVLM